jgi:endonuclease/exonuclease/phosphatase family metal-dependent hydrolase
VPTQKATIAFRIASYNIHKGIGGVDRRYRPERIVETLKRYNPDIVLMQEVDDQVPRSRHDCQVELFADALEMKSQAYQRNVTLKKGHYGNAILSRFPLVDVQHIDLTIPLKKRRRCLVAHCHLKYNGHQRTLLIANVHLGLAGFERKMQLRKILDHDAIRHTHRNTPMIVGGDFNDVWGTLGSKIMVPAGFAAAGKAIRTFPAAFPARALDHLFYRGDLQLHHAFASRSKIARQASDHLPLIVDFELTTGTDHTG